MTVPLTNRTLNPKRLPWMEYAACIGVDPELFFPTKGGNGLGDGREAKKVCNGHNGTAECPVRRACLNYALNNGEHWGIWGGKSERDRRRIRQQRERNGRMAS